MTSRRSFVTAFASLAGTVVAARPVTVFEAQAPTPPTPGAATEWDMTWLDRFKGKHKQVFDVGSFDVSVDTPLRVPMNYLDTFRDVYRLQPPDINITIGVARTAFPLNASDAIWQKYSLGERWKINDPSTGQPATRNIFLGQASGGDGATVRGLQARGALFWQCSVALGGVVGMLARATGTPAATIRAELIAGFNPGVTLVPAHALAVGLVQERGFTYEKV
jgi:hypothetical protein